MKSSLIKKGRGRFNTGQRGEEEIGEGHMKIESETIVFVG